MSITISPEERDELYGRIVVRLTGIDDVFLAVEEGDWAKAQRLGEEFSALLRLVCSDLGWGEGGNDDLSLQTPPEILRRAIASLQEMARHERARLEGEGDKIAEELGETRRFEEACQRILGSLG
jgi:hypothetical protein